MQPPRDPLEKLAWYLDQAFPIPGTRYRVGWDGIIGLIPGAGELITFLLQAGIVVTAVARHKIPGIVVVRMILNVLLDSLIGSVPLVGDIFDFLFKANTRNITLLNEVLAQHRQGEPISKARHWGFVVAVIGIFAIIFVGVIALVYVVLSFLIGVLMGMAHLYQASI